MCSLHGERLPLPPSNCQGRAYRCISHTPYLRTSEECNEQCRDGKGIVREGIKTTISAVATIAGTPGYSLARRGGIRDSPRQDTSVDDIAPTTMHSLTIKDHHCTQYRILILSPSPAPRRLRYSLFQKGVERFLYLPITLSILKHATVRLQPKRYYYIKSTRHSAGIE